MSQTQVNKLVSKLRYNVKSRRNFGNPEGPKGRHDKIRKTLTALLKHERLELNYNRGDEVRGYVERLISDAIRFGDCHQPTMDMANYWIIEKQLIHKLFKVLVPRYEHSDLSFTKLWRAPSDYPKTHHEKCILELRNNVYPPLGKDKSYQKNMIHNILLREAKKEYEMMKALKREAKLVSDKMKAEAAIDENFSADDSTAEAAEMTAEGSSSTEENLEETSGVNENLSSDEMKMSEEKGKEESIKTESNLDESANADTMKMAETEERDLSNEQNVDSDLKSEKDLNLDKMNLNESSENESTTKEK